MVKMIRYTPAIILTKEKTTCLQMRQVLKWKNGATDMHQMPAAGYDRVGYLKAGGTGKDQKISRGDQTSGSCEGQGV